jgi:hypothetical protein
VAKDDPLVNCPRGCGTMIAQSLAESGKPHRATRLDPFGDVEYYTCQ